MITLEELFTGTKITLTQTEKSMRDAPGTRNCNCRVEMRTVQDWISILYTLRRTIVESRAFIEILQSVDTKWSYIRQKFAINARIIHLSKMMLILILLLNRVCDMET